MARTTRSIGQQNTIGNVPNPILDLDPVNKQSTPTPTASARWLIESSDTSDSKYFDIFGIPQDDDIAQTVGISCKIKTIHLYAKSIGPNPAGMYFDGRKNGRTVIVQDVAAGKSFMENGDRFLPLTPSDVWIWEINSNHSTTAGAGIVTMEYEILYG